MISYNDFFCPAENTPMKLRKCFKYTQFLYLFALKRSLYAKQFVKLIRRESAEGGGQRLYFLRNRETLKVTKNGGNCVI